VALADGILIDPLFVKKIALRGSFRFGWGLLRLIDVGQAGGGRWRSPYRVATGRL